MSGTLYVINRVAELYSEGSVLPSAWNMLEHVKMIPDSTKFHEMMCRNCEPMSITCGSFENSPMISVGPQLAQQHQHEHQGRAHLHGGAERLADALRLSCAEVLAGDGCSGERDRHHRQEDPCMMRPPMPNAAWAAAPKLRSA